MENVSHSLPKRSFSSNLNAAFTSHKSVYDDVFGGPPKFGLPTLAPRLDDYSEIFGGFHASRSSSIPVLELSLVGHETDLHFDVRSSSFDYTEVFGGFGGLDFTASFEDLIGQSSGGGYDSSDEPWSPAQSGSFSDELDPLAGFGKSHRLSDCDPQQPLESIENFKASYNKSSQRSMETVLAPSTAVPGYTLSHYESSVSWDGEDDHLSMGVVDDITHSKEFDGRVREENQSKCLSNPLPSGFDTHGNDCNPLEMHGNLTSPEGRPFVTVSDISLRTEPSRLPPPSRPPPTLIVRKRECDRSISKSSKSYAFESETDGSAPLFFDVDLHATISAKGMENGDKNVKVKNRSTKELIEREYTRGYSTVQVEEKTDTSVRVSNDIGDDKLLQSPGKLSTVSVPVIEEKIEPTKSTKVTSGFPRVQSYNHSAEESFEAAWTEETEYFEVIENSATRVIANNRDTSMQHLKLDARIHQEKTECDTVSQKEGCKKFKVTKEPHRWDEGRNQPWMNGEHDDCRSKQQIEIPNTRLINQRGSPEKLVLNTQTSVYNLNKKIPENFLQLHGCDLLQRDQNETLEVPPAPSHQCIPENEVEAKLKLTGTGQRMNIDKRFVEPQIMNQKCGKLKQKRISEEFQRRLEDVEGAETTREIASEAEVTKKTHPGFSEKQIENKLEGTCELKENDVILKEGKMHEETNEISFVAAWHVKNENEVIAHEIEETEAVKSVMNELAFTEAQIVDDKENKSVHRRDAIKKRSVDESKTDDNFMRSQMSAVEAINEEEALETMVNMNFSRDTVLQGELLSGQLVEEPEPIERDLQERKVRDLVSHALTERDQPKVFERRYNFDEVITTKVPAKHGYVQMQEVTKEAVSSEGNRELHAEASSSIYDMDDSLAKGRLNESGKNISELQCKNIHHTERNTVYSPCLPKQVADSNVSGPGMRVSYAMPDKLSSAMEYSHEPEKIMFSDNDSVLKMNNAQFVSKRESINSSQVIRESVVNARKVENESSFLRDNGETFLSIKKATSQRFEKKDFHAAKDLKFGERIRRETALENEHMRKLEEEREREREREKDRMAVDKAALEAREKLYSEARDRSERAAVERATVEVRQRALAEARTSMEARLRAERAAVERATSEALQRAIEKLMVQKAAYDPPDQLERSMPNRFSASSRYTDTRQSYVLSDLHFRNTGISSGLQYSYSSAHDGAEGEYPQRCKARLERYRRTAEHAENALAEKNRRDLLAQREREERNRVAEVLDAEVKKKMVKWKRGEPSSAAFYFTIYSWA